MNLNIIFARNSVPVSSYSACGLHFPLCLSILVRNVVVLLFN